VDDKAPCSEQKQTMVAFTSPTHKKYF
jgi:hypothetical protein